ncbi:MAG TPA: ADP-ribosylglycohydrolase family protein [Bryobacteraceae bacterium]|nr:ADP-ribosylglycohydrolase family protein [Bryobacteraceae bacterium]
MQFQERVVACFKALATGDAIGKQMETLSRADVERWYPGGITGFHGQQGEVIPRYAGKRYEWRIGETTDDTEQTLAVTRALLGEGRVCHESIGRELRQCKKSLHPGVSLWAFVQSGDASRMAAEGDGCGAAMRTAPIGVLYPSSRIDELVRGAYECAIPTHGGGMAICAAAAVAGAVAAALEGRPGDDVLAVALAASKEAERYRPSGEGATVTQSISEIYSDLAGRQRLAADELARQYFPNKPQNIVPLAISLALVTESAEETALLAANIGGDSDSVASIGATIAGALHPETVNEEWFELVNAVNRDDLLDLAMSLAALRRRE